MFTASVAPDGGFEFHRMHGADEEGNTKREKYEKHLVFQYYHGTWTKINRQNINIKQYVIMTSPEIGFFLQNFSDKLTKNNFHVLIPLIMIKREGLQ